MDSSLIESSYRQEEDEVTLTTMGRTYVIDLNAMLQINEETGTARPVLRKILPNSQNAVTSKAESEGQKHQSDETSDKDVAGSITGSITDYRLEFLNKNPKLHADYVRSLFGILYEVYSSSAGPAIKHRCLRALLRMIYYANEDLLSNVLCNLTISSHIASMLASQDLKVIVIALQMSEILMQKLPNIFSIYFHREGVIHQIDRLIENAKHTLSQQTNIVDSDSASTSTTSKVTIKPELPPFSMEALLADTSKPKAIAEVQPKPAIGNPKDLDSLKRKVRPPKRAGRTNKASKNPEELAPDDLHLQSESSSFQNIMGMQKLRHYLKSSTSKIPIPMSTATSASQQQTKSSTHEAATATTVMPATSIVTSLIGTNPNYPLFTTNHGSPPLASWWNLKLQPASTSTTNSNNNNNQLAKQTTNQAASSAMPHKYSAMYLPSIPLLNQNSTTQALQQQQQQRRKASNPASKPYNPLKDYNTINYNKEMVRQWISDQAEKFRQTYFAASIDHHNDMETKVEQNAENHPGLLILKRLNKAVEKLHINEDSLESLRDISDVIYETDISSFEMIHSGLITKLFDFLTVDNSSKTKRLNQFLHVFVMLPLNQDNKSLSKQTTVSPEASTKSKSLLQNFISKLHNCINQLEQFAVRVHDIPNTVGYGKSAIKFFNTHQLKCMLQRTPESTNIRAWKGGPVKVDPLAMVTAIEKYLIMRGINKTPTATVTHNDGENSDEDDDEDGEEDDEDDDIEAALSTILGRNIEPHGPRLELLIDGNVLPSNMTIYQAIRQFSLQPDTENENDNESFTNNELWSKVHTIDYRVATVPIVLPAVASSLPTEPTTTNRTSARNHSKTVAAPATTKKSSAAVVEPITCESNSKYFFSNLNNKWLKEQTAINDASLNAIALIRILNQLNRFWYLLYTQEQNMEGKNDLFD
jgi:hypothetical protein